MFRRITEAEAQLFCDRLLAETTNEGEPFRREPGAIISSLRGGDAIFIDDGVGTAGLAPERVAIWLHSEASDPTFIYVPFFYCPSARVLELFGKVADFLLAHGFVTAKFDKGKVIGFRAFTVTGAKLGPDGLAVVSIAAARARLTALGVP